MPPASRRTRVVGRPLFEVVPSLVERGFDQYYPDALAGEVKVLSHTLHRYLVPATAAPHQSRCRRPAGSRR